MAEPMRLTCEEVFARLDDFLDRELDATELTQVRQHLDECAVCAGEQRFERSVLEGIKQKVRRIAAPAGLLARVEAAIARARAESDS